MKIKTWLTLLVLFLMNTSCIAAPIDAREIILKMDKLLRGESTRGTYKMEIIKPNWSRAISLKFWSVGKDKSMILITAPRKEKGITFLRIKTEVWNYIPSIERTIKIPPSMMMQSWMGSDFTNDDLVKESSVVNDYIHVLVAEETLRGFEVYKCRLTPKPGVAVVWGKILVWVRKKDYVPLREEFYDEDDELVNLMIYDNIKRLGGRTIPATMKMIPSRKKNHETVLTIEDIEFDIPIEDSFFSLRNIKRLR